MWRQTGRTGQRVRDQPTAGHQVLSGVTAVLTCRSICSYPPYLRYSSSWLGSAFTQWILKTVNALAGNRTRASRVAGENSTTEPPMHDGEGKHAVTRCQDELTSGSWLISSQYPSNSVCLVVLLCRYTVYIPFWAGEFTPTRKFPKLIVSVHFSSLTSTSWAGPPPTTSPKLQYKCIL